MQLNILIFAFFMQLNFLNIALLAYICGSHEILLQEFDTINS